MGIIGIILKDDFIQNFLSLSFDKEKIFSEIKNSWKILLYLLYTRKKNRNLKYIIK